MEWIFPTRVKSNIFQWSRVKLLNKQPKSRQVKSRIPLECELELMIHSSHLESDNAYEVTLHSFLLITKCQFMSDTLYDYINIVKLCRLRSRYFSNCEYYRFNLTVRLFAIVVPTVLCWNSSRNQSKRFHSKSHNYFFCQFINIACYYCLYALTSAKWIRAVACKPNYVKIWD